MTKTDPLAIDFAALRTLCLVYSCNSFSAAADALNLNQSTVSYTIDRLRRAFDDPLFVRQGGTISPTLRCEEIVASAEELLEQYSRVVIASEFDPMAAKASICVSSNYYERVTVLPALVKALRKRAPGIHLSFVQTEADCHEHLKTGKCDILLSPIGTSENGFYTRTLFSDQYVCVMDKHHPLAQSEISERAYCDANHALVAYGGNYRSPYLIEIAKKGFELNRSLSIPNPENMSDLLVGTDMISTIPCRIAQNISEELVSRPIPFPASFEISMFWTTRTHDSNMLRWMRSLIAETVAETQRTGDIIE